ncbi:L,D-transpeptidase [Streptomyces sp. NPDC093085]|uniref:L,D-transpeptidase n=1 Tax=Streptomyces sp. NPDC093085 TaxID=3155068 RepID=UPI00342DE96A
MPCPCAPPVPPVAPVPRALAGPLARPLARPLVRAAHPVRHLVRRAAAPVRPDTPARTGAQARRPRAPYAALGTAALCALALTGCSLLGSAGRAGSDDDKAAKAAAVATGTAELAAVRPVDRLSEPAPEALRGVQVNVGDGAVVGIGMPVSLRFAEPVPAAGRARIEEALAVSSTPRVTGAWSWVKDRNLDEGQRLDYRPRAYWPPGTRVTLRAAPGALADTGVPVNRRFTIGRSLIATVDVADHTMTVVRQGVATRIPVTAGAPGTETWNGVMVVSDKERRVLMDSQTVGFGDAYKDYYNYAVHLTSSGTYLHENPMADTHAGRENVTHGCVGLPTDGTARRFFDEVIPGDVVRVTGAPETVAPGNGYGDWNVPWEQWLAGGARTT